MQIVLASFFCFCAIIEALLSFLTKEIRDYVLQMRVNRGIMWQRDGQAGIVIKLPATVDFPSLAITAGPLYKEKHSSTGHCLTLQLDGKRYRATVTCLMNPSSLQYASLLTTLCSVKHVEIYAVSADLGYLGVQVLPWSAKKRRYMKACVVGQEPPKRQKWSIEAPLPVIMKREVSPLRLTYRQALQQEHVREDVSPEIVSESESRREGSLFDHLLVSAHDIHLETRQIQRFAQLMKQQIAPMIDFPNHPLWIDCPVRLAGYWRDSFGIFGLRADYEEHSLVMREGQAYYK